jgi:hypothetical protein
LKKEKEKFKVAIMNNVSRVIPSITQLEVFLIDVIIRNQEIKKLETTYFGLTLAIIRFHLEKLFIISLSLFLNNIY